MSIRRRFGGLGLGMGLGGGVGVAIDPDAQTFIDRVLADGGTVEDANFLNSFVLDAKANNYWNDIVAAYSPSWGVKGGATSSDLYSLTGVSTDLAQTTGASQPTINTGDLNGKTRILFDGIDDVFTHINFAWAQPETVVMGGFEQESWTNGDQFFDGNFSGALECEQSVSSPNIVVTLGASTTLNSDAAIGSPVHMRTLFNEASSALQIDDNAETTGTLNASGFGGFTLGARGGAIPSNFGNFSAGMVVLLDAAEDANYPAKAAAIKTFSANAYGTA